MGQDRSRVADLLDAGGEVTTEPPCVTGLVRLLSRLGWVTDLWVGGSLATGDYISGVSDLDLVAIVDGHADADRTAKLASVHRQLDQGIGSGRNLGCVYVDGARLGDVAATHPMWTHGTLVRRSLSGIARAELLVYGYAVIGRPPLDVLRPMSPDDVRDAARAELAGYWARAVRHPWWWLDPVMPDLGLTSMARARYAISTGHLLTKTRAIDAAKAPEWYIDHMRARRRGEHVVSPRIRSARIAWSDARRTVAQISR